jgi:hypothetical protein
MSDMDSRAFEGPGTSKRSTMRSKTSCGRTRERKVAKKTSRMGTAKGNNIRFMGLREREKRKGIKIKKRKVDKITEKRNRNGKKDTITREIRRSRRREKHKSKVRNETGTRIRGSQKLDDLWKRSVFDDLDALVALGPLLLQDVRFV